MKVSALARERIGGLQSIADEPRKPRVILVGQRWDPECANLRRFLARNQISFNWLTPDAPELAALWPGPAPPDGDGPALLADGQVMVRPQVRDLANRLGLQTSPRSAEYDVAIVGGRTRGPRGGRLRCLRRAAHDHHRARGTRRAGRHVIADRELSRISQRGLRRRACEPRTAAGEAAGRRDPRHAFRRAASILQRARVFLDGDEALRARTLILATGVTWRRFDIDGLDRLIGKGVYYGAARSEASATHGQDIHLVGAGNSAGQAALHFANHARKVTLVVRGDTLEKSMSHYLIEQLRTKSNIAVQPHSEITALHGDKNLTAIDVRDISSSQVHRHDCGGLFIFIGADAETEWLPESIARDNRGYVLTGDDLKKAGSWSHSRDPYLLETSVPGVFACGDVRLSPVKRVASAVGEGSMAIAFVHQYLASQCATARAAVPNRPASGRS